MKMKWMKWMKWMKSKKKKLVLSLICSTAYILLSQINPSRPWMHLAAVLSLILFVSTMLSIAYLTVTLARFIIEKLVDYDDKEKALQRPLKQRIGRNILVWFILASIFGVLVGSFNLPTFFALSKRGVSTAGRELKTTKGLNVGYEFKVGQKIIKYSVSKQKKEKTHLGAKVTVVYDPLNPQVSVMGPVKPRLDNELISVGMVILLFPAFTMFFFKRSMMPAWRRAFSKR